MPTEEPTMTDDEDGDSGPHSEDSWHAQDSQPQSPVSAKSSTDLASTAKTSATADNNISSNNPSLPVQKRRRVTRACDECRRKKIKCDGKSPCTHCTVYSYDCTYDKPSNRRRNPAPQYIEALENRLYLTETLLRKFMPDVDLGDPNLEPAVQHEFRKRAQARAKVTRSAGAPNPTVGATAASAATNRKTTAIPNTSMDLDDSDGELKSMLESIGHLKLDDGGWEFHGTSSGAVFLQRMMQHLGGGLGQTPFLPLPRTRPPMPSVESSPTGPAASPFNSVVTGPELPPRHVARSLCSYAITYGACLIRILHLPTFYETLDRIYDKPPDGFSDDELRFLGLLYAVIAVGCMYRHLGNPSESSAWNRAKEEGTKWYTLSETILPNITDTRDITSLQALVFRIVFLQSTSGLSCCYAHIGIALRCALRMGLHRHLKHEHISPIEQEVRRRIFWALRQMDIYVSVLLGFPIPLSRDEIDQAYPTEVDDEYITMHGVQPVPAGTWSFFQPFNALTDLMEILAKISKYVYPMKGLWKGSLNDREKSYNVGYAQIKEIEADLAKWYENLPATWRPISDGPAEVIRMRHHLRFTYAHVQLVLYRPFLHYASPRLSQQKKVDDLSYACAAAGISVSRNIIHIGAEMRKQSALSGPYWLMLYTEFFAALSLVFYAIENPDKPGTMEVLEDARCARLNVSKPITNSPVAENVAAALSELFEQLPPNLDSGIPMQVPSKKRAASSQAPIPPPRAGAPSNSKANGAPTPRHRQSADSHHSPSATPLYNKGVVRKSTDLGHKIQIGRAKHPMPLHPSAGNLDYEHGIQDYVSIEMGTSPRATSESTGGAPSSVHSCLPESNLGSPLQGATPLHRLSSLMFPSADPFAYPNQPMMELDTHQRRQRGNMQTRTEGVSQPQQLDSSHVFMARELEEMDGQLLGEGFVMDHQRGGGQAQQNMEVTDPMFDAMFLAMHGGSGAQGAQGSQGSESAQKSAVPAQARAPVSGQVMATQAGRGPSDSDPMFLNYQTDWQRAWHGMDLSLGDGTLNVRYRHHVDEGHDLDDF